MSNIMFWDGTSNLILANGQEVTPDEIIRKYPFSKTGKAVLEKSSRNGHVLAIHSLDILCENYQIANTMTDDQALSQFVKIRTTEITKNAESYSSSGSATDNTSSTTTNSTTDSNNSETNKTNEGS
jgi:hypothetical protein